MKTHGWAGLVCMVCTDVMCSISAAALTILQFVLVLEAHTDILSPSAASRCCVALNIGLIASVLTYSDSYTNPGAV